MLNPIRSRIRKLHLLLLFALVLPTVWSTPAAAAPPGQKLNVVLFLVDDLGGRDLGCYGSSFYETPHTDQLRRMASASHRRMPPATSVRPRGPVS